MQLYLWGNQSIDRDLRLIYEIWCDNVNVRIYAERILWIEIWWFKLRSSRCELLGLRIEVRIHSGRGWAAKIRVVRGRCLLGCGSAVGLLTEMACETRGCSRQVGVLRGTRHGHGHLRATWSYLLLWEKTLTCSIHHGCLETLFSRGIINNDSRNKSHHFCQIGFLGASLRGGPIIEVWHFDLVLRLKIWLWL